MIALLLLSHAHAAELTLEGALQQALVASEDVAAAEAELASAGGGETSARAAWLPSVSGAATYDRTFASEYDDLFGGGTSPFGDASLPFGAANTWRVGLSASQTLYAGGALLGASRIASATQRSAQLSVEQARASAALGAAQAYLDAALADALLAIAEATQAQADATLQTTRASQEQGRTPEFELLRADVAAQNQRVVVLQQRQARDLAYQQLRSLLDLPADEPLTLVSAVGDGDGEAAATAAAGVVGVDLDREQRAVEQQMADTVDMASAGVTIARSAWLPKIAASASYGWVSYPDDVLPPAPGDDWARNVSAGLALSVPLYSGGASLGDYRDALGSLHAAQAVQDQAQELAALERQQLDSALQTARARWQATSGTVAQAERAYAIAEVRYQEGISTQIELADARLLLSQASANRASAWRDLVLASLQLTLLPALPLGGGASSY